MLSQKMLRHELFLNLTDQREKHSFFLAVSIFEIFIKELRFLKNCFERIPKRNFSHKIFFVVIIVFFPEERFKMCFSI